MEPGLKEFIDKKFAIPIQDGEDKRCTPEQAIERYVEKGMSIYTACGFALLNPLIKAFWGQHPEFTVITTGVTLQLHAMLYGGLVKKFITSFAGHTYPSPRPCPIVQKAYQSKQVEIENWTMRTIIQRMLAAAMGFDFIPCTSLIGSSMQEDNKHAFTVIEDPFAPNQKKALLKSLRPDITLAHCAAADPCGNAIYTYPLYGDAYGAWASKKGVILSTEKIVSTEYIRQYSHLTRIPAQSVLAVCECPFGLHPHGVTQHGLPGFENAYFPDYQFQTELANATNDEDEFNRWINEWILECRDQEQYLSKLGTQRLLYLRGKADKDAWKTEIEYEVKGVDLNAPPNALERMVVAGAEVIADLCISQRYESILAGIGTANLAAWLGARLISDKGYKIDLLAEVGMVGYLPRASDPSVFSFHNIHTCTFLNNIETTLGYLVGGPNSHCLGVLGAGQIDVQGNVNSTLIPNVTYLVGSGGSNDIAATSQQSLVLMISGKNRMLKKVPYITYPGDKVRTLITDIGVFEKRDGDNRFALSAYVPLQGTTSERECISAIQERVGWELTTAPQLKRIDPPDHESLTLLRLFDPRGFFIKE